MTDLKVTLLILLASTIRMSTPITLAAVGGTFSARTGTMALGLEGFMLMGAWGAALGSYLFQNAWMGLLMGILVSLAVSFLFGRVHHPVSRKPGDLRNRLQHVRLGLYRLHDPDDLGHQSQLRAGADPGENHGAAFGRDVGIDSDHAGHCGGFLVLPV